MSNCHFCQLELETIYNVKYNYTSVICSACALNNNLSHVLSCYPGEPNRRHIVSSTRIGTKLNNKDYVAIYNSDRDITLICQDVREGISFPLIFSIPGSPIIPSNFNEKLPIYLTFS